jgi:hypothetical protein
MGQEGYTDPSAGDAGVGDVAPGTVDPVYVVGSEGTEPKPDGDYTVTDTKTGNEGEVTEPKPDGGSEIVGSETNDGEYRITLLPEGSQESAGSTPEGVLHLLTLAVNGDAAALATQFPSDAANVGMPERINQWSGLLVANHPNLGTMPELSQIRSGVGLDMTTQMAALSDAVRNVPTFTGQINNVASQISGQAQEAFSAFPIRGVADLLANQ